MSETTVQGMHRVAVGKDDHADIELRYKRIQILPPIGKQKRYPSLSLTILHARASRSAGRGSGPGRRNNGIRFMAAISQG
jgi:hypothetical protein